MPHLKEAGELYSTLVDTIIDNAQVIVHNVHVRFEDASRRMPSVFGIIMDRLSAVSADANYNPKLVLVLVLCALRSFLSLFARSDPHTALSHPFSPRVSLHNHRINSKPPATPSQVSERSPAHCPQAPERGECHRVC